MLFLALRNANIQFGAKKLIQRSYTPAKALPTTSQMELINKKEVAKAAIDRNSETFIMYRSALDIANSLIYLFQTAQIVVL